MGVRTLDGIMMGSPPSPEPTLSAARTRQVRNLCVSIARGSREATTDITTLVGFLSDKDTEIAETAAFALRFLCRNDADAAMRVLYLNAGTIMNNDRAADLAAELLWLAGGGAGERLFQKHWGHPPSR